MRALPFDRMRRLRSAAALPLIGLLCLLSGCTGPDHSYTVGGTVTGLAAGSTVVLVDNGSDTLPLTGNGSFTFANALATGDSYAVRVQLQPNGQQCTVSNASGSIAQADVSNVLVSCSTAFQAAWQGGNPGTAAVAGVYGTLGVAAAGNVPGARQGGSTWVDASGTFWLFGGQGLDSSGNLGYLNDLWKYSAGQWTWVAGGSARGGSGSYGVRGTAAASNLPGARYYANAWVDASGNFWLFGGYGVDGSGSQGRLNDLWQFSNGSWTWVSGASTANATGSYGTLGVPASGNTPGARNSAVSWVDASGALWLFGGFGIPASAPAGLGDLNDLWRFSAGQWTWMGGANILNHAGVYGAPGLAASANQPGARHAASGWVDSSGTFWLFGGVAYDATGLSGDINDLWRYSNGLWTWVSGATIQGAPGTYGIEGTAASANVPGARDSALTWIDSAGNVWLFGGQGHDATGVQGSLNDLWKYSSGAWTWQGGSTTAGAVGLYGQQGVAVSGNFPGARFSAMNWIDTSGNLWLFGGFGDGASSAYSGNLNDLWEITP